ncbi:MAG TPA: GTPase Era [Pseudomonadales bacterium]|nr:GTPase Era [Pseudomonadales bacterium]
MDKKTEGRVGYVAIVGRPNVGKSTLLNHMLGQKLSITSRKPQTTRHRILGIKTEGNAQILFLDTPGLHRNEPKAINRYMNRAAMTSLVDVDVILFVIDALKWTPEDAWVLESLKKRHCPVILVVNKVDRVKDKERFMAHLQHISQQFAFKEVFPISALRGENLARLEQAIIALLPPGQLFYDEDQITDRPERFVIAELIREKIMRQLGDELPYEVTIEIEDFVREGNLLTLSAVILVERDSQKAIVIGKGGQRLKKIGSEARADIEALMDCRVMLSLWVKVKSGWSDDDRALRSLGYDDF